MYDSLKVLRQRVRGGARLRAGLGVLPPEPGVPDGRLDGQDRRALLHIA